MDSVFFFFMEENSTCFNEPILVRETKPVCFETFGRCALPVQYVCSAWGTVFFKALL